MMFFLCFQVKFKLFNSDKFQTKNKKAKLTLKVKVKITNFLILLSPSKIKIIPLAFHSL